MNVGIDQLEAVSFECMLRDSPLIILKNPL